MSHTLCAEDLHQSHGRKPILRGVHVSINSGEVVGLLGPNGAGKTTLFDVIMGQIQPEKGQISLNDTPLKGLPMYQRASMGIGYLPQENAIFRQLSLADNIMAALEMRPSLTQAQRLERLEALLDEFNLGDIRDTLGSRASGGERRRAEIARALAMEPQFMLLDEPFAGIDPVSIHAIKHMIRHLAHRGIGVFITDHNVSETLNLCDRAYLLYRGQVLCEGTAEVITQHSQAQQVYFGEHFQW